MSHSVEWTSAAEPLRLAEVLHRYGRYTDVLFRTTEGYEAERESETLACGDVIFIHFWNSQSRVVAKDAGDRLISLPLQYPIKFRQIKGGKSDTLSKLVGDSRTLPQHVTVASDEATFYYKERKTRVKVPIGDLELIRMYEETYAVAHTVLHGVLQSELAVVPTYLPVRGVVGCGLELRSDQEWTALMSSYKEFVQRQNIRLDTLIDRSEIYLYSGDLNVESENLYAEIQPERYVKFDMTSKGKTQNEAPLKHGSNRRDQSDKQILQKFKNTFEHTPLKSTIGSLKESEVVKDGGDYGRLMSGGKVMESNYTTLGQATDSPSHVQSSPPSNRESSDYQSVVRELRLQEGLSRTRVEEKSAGGATSENTHVKPDSVEKESKPNRKLNTQIKTYKSLLSKPSKYVTSSHNQSKGDQIKADSSLVEPDHPQSRKVIECVNDIPDDLSELSVEEVCDCLQILNMGTHADCFRENQIDGVLLTSLDVDTFVSSFQIPKISALKLEKFIHHKWRPKLM